MECHPYFLVLIFNDPHVCQLSGEPLPLAPATTAVRVQAARDEDDPDDNDEDIVNTSKSRQGP